VAHDKLKGVRFLLFFCLVSNAWAKGDANSKEDPPYERDSLPASYSQEEKAKMKVEAHKKAEDFFGKTPPTDRKPENKNEEQQEAEDGSPSAGD
jgi:hypothetical protein